MIEVKDRVPTYPGRVKLIPVAGQANTYDLVRADEPIEAGTPINRALFQALLADIDAIRQQVDDKLFEISNRARIGDLTVGTIIGLYENGVLVPFIVLHTGYPNSGRVLVVRKNCIMLDVIRNSGETFYENCKIDVWLDNEYPPMLDRATQGVIAAVPIYVGIYGGQGQINRKVFLLSLGDYQLSFSGVNANEGSASVRYFSSTDRKIATLDGTPVNHWTRSAETYGKAFAYVTANGTASTNEGYSFPAGIRPAFTLPVDFEVTVGDPSTSNVMATAEVI